MAGTNVTSTNGASTHEASTNNASTNSATAHPATNSAAVAGFADSFGLQALSQDVVTGVTLILSNTMYVCDRVELSGIVGRVERIGLRCTKLITFYTQEILVPNREVKNITRFPHGGI